MNTETERAEPISGPALFFIVILVFLLPFTLYPKPFLLLYLPYTLGPIPYTPFFFFPFFPFCCLALSEAPMKAANNG